MGEIGLPDGIFGVVGCSITSEPLSLGPGEVTPFGDRCMSDWLFEVVGSIAIYESTPFGSVKASLVVSGRLS